MSDRMLPVHPGKILDEDFLKPMGISQTRLGLDTGMPQSRVQGIIAGKRGISADTAVRLAAYFGNSAEFWLNCQVSYELDMVAYSGKRDKILSRVHPHPAASSVPTLP
ncbi:HigA family addiction module antitoxin [Desulfovibrio falkowii]|uniref:HigA family addiction module antitoxin n=1 Tax=Desulfovibrio falkowii TaxID=3136602 RepID=A0ABQ0EC58_9BACT